MRRRMRWWERVLWVLVPAVAIVGAGLVAGGPAGAGSYTPTCEEQPGFYDCIPVTPTPDATTTATTVPATTTTSTTTTSTTVPASTTTIVSESPTCIDQPDLPGCPTIPPKLVDVPETSRPTPVVATPDFTG